MELEKPAGYSLASLLFLFKELGWKNAIIIIYQAIFTHIDLYFMLFFLFTMKYILFYTLPSDCSGQRHKVNFF